ncbi:hypothetical protein [Acidisoma silvae]|uniref:Uncharacterized protein n=1 Tax=Acidisoma silvae TaxID=2802396 RepID=A0A964DX87_9PROT|nr:hypothetical protein [Acidisoma silvae]MCB8873782.1 hypothetical protein [Acidisoma silvae]
MRRLFAAFVAASVFAPGIASAACLKPIEGTAMNVAGLKSQLMVTALACDTRDRYNSFVMNFRPTLMKEDTALNSYFSHHYGRSWRAEHDDYITQLANVQSDASIKQGTLFCQQNVALFGEVLALKTPKELLDFANDKPMVQPVNYDICGLPHHDIYHPTLVQVVAPVGGGTSGAKEQTAVARTGPDGKPKRSFFGNIGHGIASIF